MKLKLGLLLVGLMAAQLSTPVVGMTEVAPGIAQRDALSQVAQDYLAAQKIKAGGQTVAKPTGLTADQQAAYNKLVANITTISNTIRSNLIPAVSTAIANRGFGFMDGITLATSTGPTLFTAVTDAVTNIKTLHNTKTSARAVIKNNLVASLNQVGFTDIVNQLVNLVNKLPDGAAKSLLGQIVPQLKEVPGLITSLL